MRGKQRDALAGAISRLMDARSLDEAARILSAAARGVTGADGIAVVRRFGDWTAYIAEDAIAPLWAGRRFPIDECAAGTAILDNRPLIVPNVAKATNLPLNLYLSTFIRRMAAYPFGLPEPAGALCAYWSREGDMMPDTDAALLALARATGGIFAALDELERARAAA